MWFWGTGPPSLLLLEGCSKSSFTSIFEFTYLHQFKTFCLMQKSLINQIVLVPSLVFISPRYLKGIIPFWLCFWWTKGQLCFSSLHNQDHLIVFCGCWKFTLSLTGCKQLKSVAVNEVCTSGRYFNISPISAEVSQLIHSRITFAFLTAVLHWGLITIIWSASTRGSSFSRDH